MDDRIVIALGGNALGDTPTGQLERIHASAPAIIGLIDQNYEIVITHGNGPQVGLIQQAFEIAHEVNERIPKVDLPECGAMSQGYIGYHLQQGLLAEIHRRGMPWHIASVVTQTVVGADDPSFQSPTKPIGSFYSTEDAKRLMEESPDETYIEDSGRGWRRVVASPKPIAIVERDSILSLLDNEFIVIASGGGGIPVVADGDGYRGIAAVIDKDLAAEILAEEMGATYLFLLTAVDRVALNYGTPEQIDLDEITVEEARKYIQEGHFAPGSMLPKIEAALKFVESHPDRVAIIGSLDKALETIAGRSGTRIVS